MKPYYEQDGIVIYHGDCREIIPELGHVDTVITDPVWPNSSPTLIGHERPYELFAEACALLNCDRLIVQLGCDSDPRFLAGVPASFRYFRTCWLEYACPTRKGRVLYTGDVAYAFGVPPKSAPGRRVISGRFLSSRSDTRRVSVTKHKEWDKPGSGHPAPRRYDHVRWIVSRFADGTILDPFCGQGTTLRAAKEYGYPSIGIEIEERWAELAAKRLGQSVMQFGAKA